MEPEDPILFSIQGPGWVSNQLMVKMELLGGCRLYNNIEETCGPEAGLVFRELQMTHWA